MFQKCLGIAVIILALIGLGSCGIIDEITNKTPPPLPNLNNDYEILRSWLLEEKGYLTARWGDASCDEWNAICKGIDCGDCKHTGVDYGTNKVPENVYSVADGVVVGLNDNCGKICIYDETTDVTFCYFHLSSFEIASGSVVRQGQLIGKTGKKCADEIHLHFEAIAGRQENAACCFSQTINPIEAAELARTTTYVNQNNPDEYLELKADGTFYLMEMGIGFTGEWEVEGDVLRLYYSELGITLEGRIKGNRIIDPDGKVWIRQSTFP